MNERLTQAEYDAVRQLQMKCCSMCRDDASTMVATHVVERLLERHKPEPDVPALARDFFAHPHLRTRRPLWEALASSIHIPWPAYSVNVGADAQVSIEALPQMGDRKDYAIKVY